MIKERVILLDAFTLKWKNVFEDCFVEYCVLTGSRAGVTTTLLLIIAASWRLPESKLELRVTKLS